MGRDRGDAARTTCHQAPRKLLERGVISRIWRVCHVAPPLVVTEEQINRMVVIADGAFTVAEGEFAAEFDG